MAAPQKKVYARPAKPWKDMTPEEKREFATDLVANINKTKADK